MTVKEIKFVDVTGQKYHFALDADDGINSLELGPVNKGVQTLSVNGDEQYRLRAHDIIDAR